MNKCIYKGYNCKYASESGYCEIGNENCIKDISSNDLEIIEDYLFYDEIFED